MELIELLKGPLPRNSDGIDATIDEVACLHMGINAVKVIEQLERDVSELLEDRYKCKATISSLTADKEELVSYLICIKEGDEHQLNKGYGVGPDKELVELIVKHQGIRP